jgi:hypothetical protein
MLGVVGRMGVVGGPGVKGRRLLDEGEAKLAMEAMGEVGYCVDVADNGRDANRLVVAGYGGAGAVLELDNVASRDEGKACEDQDLTSRWHSSMASGHNQYHSHE